MVTPKFTRHQVPRGAMPDADVGTRLYLIKNVSSLHATYQVRVLLVRAMESGKKLVLCVPRACKLEPDLAALRKEHGKHLLVERV